MNIKTLIATIALIAGGLNAGAQASSVQSPATPADTAVVYMTRDISPQAIIRLYEALGNKAHGKVAIKISTGEPGGHNFLSPDLIAPFVNLVDGTIVECNTAYAGKRYTSEDHLQAAKDHGFTAIAPVDIMDSEGEVRLPLRQGGRHLEFDIVGSHYPDYDFTVILSHFKGHAMGGFGGAVKNMSIGIASGNGKMYIHSAGATQSREGGWKAAQQDDFLESMAEAAKCIADHAGNDIIYISVANNLSVDCDCSSHPEAPQMHDIGVLASLDPIALDKACTDLVRTSDDPGKVHLIERMDSRHGMHTLDYGEQIGLGSQTYKLIVLE